MGYIELPKPRLATGNFTVKQSISVRRVRDGALLYSYQPNLPLNPASLTKLVTTAASLAHWGSAHQFTTKVFHTGNRVGKRIVGDLLLVGSGDPYLVSEKMWEFASFVKNAGIETIEGKVIIDNTLFSPVVRSSASSENAYDAPLSAFGINFNTVAVQITPAPKLGAKATVSLFPFPLPSVRLVDQGVKTVAKRTKIKVARLPSRDSASAFKLEVSGRIAIGHAPMLVYRSISQPLRISTDYVQGFLADRGIKVLGKNINVKSTPTPFYDIKGYPLSYIVKGLNTFSNNYIADMLVKKLGTELQNKQQKNISIDMQSGVASLGSYLHQEIGIKTKFVLKNGSGLSLQNRFSAEQLTKLLIHVARRMQLFPDFIAALPASGLEGTLLHRMTEFAGMVRVKTGTLTNPRTVSGLAGYYHSKEHGLVAFTMIANGISGKSQPPIDYLRQRQDRLLAYISSDRE